MTCVRTVLVCLPLAAAFAVRLVLLSASIGGRPIQWGHERLTLSEAAAFGDAGEVVRLLAAGQDVNASYTVRRGAVRGRAEATPLEAARASGRADMVQLLLEESDAARIGR